MRTPNPSAISDFGFRISEPPTQGFRLQGSIAIGIAIAIAIDLDVADLRFRYRFR